jgi:hypothetical protein
MGGYFRLFQQTQYNKRMLDKIKMSTSGQKAGSHTTWSPLLQWR